MDIGVYLPDELGAEAKEAGLPFSALLRAAVIDELAQRKARAETVAEPQTYEIELVDRDTGASYVGRITGKLIGGQGYPMAPLAFLTVDERVLLYDGTDAWEPDDVAGEMRELLPAGEYADACRALCIKAVVDL